ncbi:SCP2 sterol-binding domain-containing protein [Thermocrinis minervae]|uniref:Putative sterol carrier protein n=1 Tax=Thermocrinis minervae TaxID=381751 RepID=A0A1M6TG03_9AQUI|nr:SCP2 sterol-binding domain-containing protein [Thermocrinis minervae]SHK55776.1 Putative sterol carrier protein [Thermocrinis minervae]
MKKLLGFTLLGMGISFSAPIFMDAEYAKELCHMWNKTPQLVEELGKSESWMAAPERKIFIYREDCGDKKQIQLTIKNENGKAVCVYGGWAKDKRGKDDFLMYAETKRWLEMGRKEYGPMKAMMLGRLKFEGPKFVAMKNMGPFEAFLDIVDNPPHDSSRCP